MSEDLPSYSETSIESRLFVPALALARYAPRGATLVVGIFMVEIGRTFGTPVGITSQLNTAFSFVATLTALSMGVLTIRFKLRTLLLTGITLALISAVGFMLTPSFSFVFLLYSLNGVAWSLIYPMSTALVGEHLTLKKRPDALAWVTGLPAVITVLGSTFLGYIGSWHLALLLYSIPIAVMAFILSVKGVPKVETPRERTDLMGGFKAIQSSRSALSCLTAMLMQGIAWQMIMMMSLPYLRDHFGVSIMVTSLIYSGFALANFIGAKIGGKAVNRFGRKPVAVTLQTAFGVCVILFIMVQSVHWATFLGITACLVTGIRSTAVNSLAIEQLPRVRGAMMSFSTAFRQIGSTLSTGIGGFLLLAYGWKVMGVIMGAFGVLGGLILLIFAIDPTIQS